MTKNQLAIGCRIAVLPIIFALVQQWKTFIIFFHIDTGFGFTIFTLIVIAIFTLLNLITAIGLALVKQWGLILSYFTIPLSTIFFGAAYVPFVTNPVAIITTNLIVLFYIIFLHTRWRKHKRQAK